MAKRRSNNIELKSVSAETNGAETSRPNNGDGRHHAATLSATSDRLPILKTYKLFIGGKFPRTESGRYYTVKNPSTDTPLANVCQSSRKDFREAVIAARSAQDGWAGKSSYNRCQILYRIAEMLEGRSTQFVSELVNQGVDATAAKSDVAVAIDRLVYYAGWTDKYQQIFSSVNPVASSHFNFSVQEPTGVVAVIGPKSFSLAGLIGTIAPVIAGGNTAIALASRDYPLNSITLAEVLATSDLPGGGGQSSDRGSCRARGTFRESHGCECDRDLRSRRCGTKNDCRKIRPQRQARDRLR